MLLMLISQCPTADESFPTDDGLANLNKKTDDGDKVDDRLSKDEGNEIVK